MKMVYHRRVWLVLSGFVLVSCTASKPHGSGTSSAPATLAGPVPHYSPAREGLPKSRIWKSQIAFGDVNGDGFPDLGTVSRLADGPWIFVGDGKGNWTAASDGLPREPFCGGGMDFGDVNKDGKMDVAIADHCKGVFVYFGDGSGHWTTASAGLPQVGSEDVALADFNSDGCLDLVAVAAAEEGVRAFVGNCKGVWKESSTGLAHSEWGNSVVVADMNGDGKADVIAAYSAGPRVWLGDGKGEFREASEGLPAPEVHGLFWGIAVGDLNKDGKPDIVATDQSRGAQVFLQQDGGKYIATETVQCAGGASNGNFCSTDADCPGGACSTSVCKGVCSGGSVGKPCLTNEECREGSHAGVPASEPVCQKGTSLGSPCRGGSDTNECPGGACARVSSNHGIPPMNALGVAIGDLNNDGNADLVVAGKTNMEEIGGVYGVYVMLGDGRGNFTLLRDDGLPDGMRERTWGAGLADIDRDGVLDIAVAFGDVLPPAWRSGATTAPAKPTEKPGFFASLFGSEKKPAPPPAEAAPVEKPRAPERGFFGTLEVWRGQIK